jgi:hypothetical protein
LTAEILLLFRLIQRVNCKKKKKKTYGLKNFGMLTQGYLDINSHNKTQTLFPFFGSDVLLHIKNFKKSGG